MCILIHAAAAAVIPALSMYSTSVILKQTLAYTAHETCMLHPICFPMYTGPKYSEAVQLFISAFQAWLEDMHTHTEHVINGMQVSITFQCVCECVSAWVSVTVAFCHALEMCSHPPDSKHNTLH